MRSGTCRGVSKWLKCKDRYIGRLYSDIEKVPSDSGIFRSTRELRKFVLGLNGPYGKGEKGLKVGCAPSPWTGPNWTREGGRPLPSFSFSNSYQGGEGRAAHLWPPLLSSTKAH